MSGHLSLTSFIIGAFAVWRVAHLIASEDGPGDLIFKMRERLGSSFPGRLMDCFQCVSLWVATPALVISAPWTERLIAWFAISGAACLLDQVPAQRHIPALKDLGGTNNVVLWQEENGTDAESNHAAPK